MRKGHFKLGSLSVLGMLLASCMQSPANVPVYNINNNDQVNVAKSNSNTNANNKDNSNSAFEATSSDEAPIDVSDFSNNNNLLTPVFEPENAVASNTGTYADFNKLDYKVAANSSSTKTTSKENASTTTTPTTATLAGFKCLADFNFTSSLPRDANGVPDYKQIKKGSYKAPIYLVQKGDSLYRVAYLTARTEDEIKSFNNLASNDVRAGSALAVAPSCSITTLGQDGYTKAVKSIEDAGKRLEKGEAVTAAVDYTKALAKEAEDKKAQLEAQAKAELERKQKAEAEAKAKAKAEADRLKAEADRTKAEAEQKLKAEAEKVKADAEKAKQDAQDLANKEKQAANEAAAKAEAEAAKQKAEQEAAAKAKEEADAFNKAREEAKAKVDAEKARIEAEKVAAQARADAAPKSNSGQTEYNVNGQATGGLQWPASGKVIGTFTNKSPSTRGLSIAGSQGDRVVAADGGQVIYAGSQLDGYGNLVILKHPNGMLTLYAHNSKLLVKIGDKVSRGQQIALMGNSATTSNKLYFEVRSNGRAVDPLKYLEPR